jgi:hypothetical protein
LHGPLGPIKRYANTVKYFRKIEDDEDRKDDREGSINCIPLDPSFNIKIRTKDGNEIPLVPLNGEINQYDPLVDSSHLFCLCYFNDNDVTGKPFLDPRNKRFGDKALIITEPERFINLIISKTKSKFKALYMPVKYYERPTSEQKLNIFDKPNRFSYQREFRFNFQEYSEDPLIFDIGDISRISKLIDASILDQLIIEKGKDNGS